MNELLLEIAGWLGYLERGPVQLQLLVLLAVRLLPQLPVLHRRLQGWPKALRPLPGIALASLLGGDLLLGAALGAAVMVGGVSVVGARSRLGEDTAIGLLFVGMLALGVAIISARGAYAGDLTTILFGDPIGVGRGDLRVLAVTAVVTLVVSVVGYRPFLALTYDRAKARTLGLHPRATHLVMLALVALVVVSSFRAVGTLLVFAFLVAPPATAVLVARRVAVVMAASVAFGSLAVVVGLLASYHLATATAATIAGVSVLGFFAVLLGRDLGSAVRRRTLSGSPRSVR